MIDPTAPAPRTRLRGVDHLPLGSCGIALPKRDERRWLSRSGRYRGAIDGDRLSSEACSRSSASA
jgi:hypothetical protein